MLSPPHGVTFVAKQAQSGTEVELKRNERESFGCQSAVICVKVIELTASGWKGPLEVI